MKSTQQNAPQRRHQMTLTLDGRELREMTPAERSAAVGALASLLLEAAGVPAREAHDDCG